MPKLPDWHCSKCNFTIFGSKQFCGKCGEKNPNWDRSTTEASKPSAAASDSNTTTTMKNGREKLPDWFCEPCQFWVFGSKRTCRCGKENPNWPSSASASSGNNNNKNEQQPAAASTSSSSSAPAPVAPAPASQQQQQQQQPEQQQQQRQQRGGRGGGGGGGRAPDFHCPNCKFNVYGSKPACGKCGYPNPAW